MKVYVLIQEGIYKDCDEDATCWVFATPESAQAEMKRQYEKIVQDYGAYQLAEGEDEFQYKYVATIGKLGAAVYESGAYGSTHEAWSIYEKEVQQ